jgi:hypothetical protein
VDDFSKFLLIGSENQLALVFGDREFESVRPPCCLSGVGCLFFVKCP